MCGSRKDWGEKQTEIAETYGLTFRKVSFVAKEVTENKLMWKAVSKGIRNYPFFTDGVTFSKTLADFVDKQQNVAQIAKKTVESVKKLSEKPTKSAKKTKRSTRRKKNEVKDGDAK